MQRFAHVTASESAQLGGALDRRRVAGPPDEEQPREHSLPETERFGQRASFHETEALDSLARHVIRRSPDQPFGSCEQGIGRGRVGAIEHAVGDLEVLLVRRKVTTASISR